MPGCVPPRASSCRPDSEPVSTAASILVCALGLQAASPSPSPAGPPAAAPAPALVMVVPPEQTGTSAETAWLGEAVSDLLPRALALAGVPAVERADRLRAQAALEIPRVPLTRATAIRVAEALGARRLVVGEYTAEGQSLSLSLRLLDGERGTLSAPFVSSGALADTGLLVYGAAWDMALALTSPPAVSRDDFFARRPQARFEAMRAYGLGLLARNAATRVKLLRQAVVLEPSFHEARLALGRLQIETGEYTAGHDSLARIPDASPLARAARFAQGVALLEIGRYREAAAVYARLAAEAPSAAVLNNQGLALLRAPAPPERASAVLRRALELEPAERDLAFNTGWTLLAEGDPAAAEFFLRDVVARAPLDAHARVVLAWALRRAGRTAEADQEWKGVVTLAPTYQGLTAPDLARRFERIQPGERMLVLDRGGRSAAEVAAGLVGRADRLLATGDAEGALRELERAVYLDPHANRVHVLLARAYRARGMHERALSEYQMMLWSVDDPPLRAELAALLKEMGRLEEARREAEKVLKVEPGNEAARRVLQR
jgi:tetratricopeptide (TPR) repeat protein